MKRIIVLFVSLLLYLTSSAGAQGSGMELGSGARAMAFAGNHTAAANDLSAVYWNPAALAFLQVREAQASFDAMRISGTSGLSGAGLLIPNGAKLSDNRDRVRLSGIGAMTAIPTVQGGLTLAASFDRPYIFDDFTVYTYKKGAETMNLDGGGDGDLNRWSAAFGIQVAQKISVGLTLSIVSGTEEAYNFQKRISDFPEDIYEKYPYLTDYYDVEFQRKYLGYALAVGALCYPVDNLKVGVKVNVVDNVGFVETQYYKLFPDSKREKSPSSSKGRLYSAPSGAIGAELTLPWLTAAFDLRATLPYTFILPSVDVKSMPDGLQTRNIKAGVGFGVEAPVPNLPIVLRAGYSFDEYDLFPRIAKYEGYREDGIDWDYVIGKGTTWRVAQNRHTIAAGAGVFTSGIGLELSYDYRTWGVASKTVTEGISSLKFSENYSSHRVMTAIIFRY
ncbi:MAG: hypothetical protein LBB74_03660 [Chitinispirillales bacterium]|jgi:hypothetical protein|nr:hypothetical protein [Chitinispirillales bacterium]